MTTTEACARGCALYRQHPPTATPTTAEVVCRAARSARPPLLAPPSPPEMMLTDADTLDRWLTGNLASGQAPRPRT